MGQKAPIQSGQNERQEELSQCLEEDHQESYEVPLGCPDWGPPGARKCYECGEPVDEDLRNCTGVYSDPLSEIVGKCQICGAPDYNIYGHCHECEGPVLNLGDEFYGCYHVVRDACSFKISISHLEKLDLYPHEISIKHLLAGSLTKETIYGSEAILTLYQLDSDDQGEWDVKMYDCSLSEDSKHKA